MQALAASGVARCFLCERTSEKVVWREAGVDGRLCDCGLLYADTGGSARERLDLAHEFHPETFYSASARFKARWMAAHFLRAARQLGYDVAGLEPHPDRAASVARELGIPMEQAFIEDDSLPPGRFDVVYHCDLLAHFPDPFRALSSMTRLLRPGGVLCFEVGILGDISPVWYRLIEKIGLGHHLFLYSFRSLDVLLDRAALDVVHRQNYGLGPQVILRRPFSVFASGIVRPLLSMARIPDSAAKAERFERFTNHAARYHVGRVAPLVGPATSLIVARPRERNGR